MRGFLPDRLEKHREACRKLESRPTKVFNATAMRTAGTELESYIKRGAHQKDVPVSISSATSLTAAIISRLEFMCCHSVCVSAYLKVERVLS